MEGRSNVLLFELSQHIHPIVPFSDFFWQALHGHFSFNAPGRRVWRVRHCPSGARSLNGGSNTSGIPGQRPTLFQKESG
jgi:hypothetical protein